ncbi:MAG: ABC transporter substrate-binding protein [Elusimicrobiota bacterium]
MNRLPLVALTLILAGASTRAQDKKASGALTGDQKAVDALVRDTVERVMAVLKTKETAQADKKDQVIKIIDPIIDMSLMAKLTLGRNHWPKLDEKQRKEFTDLFKEQLKTSYFEKLDLLTDEKVEYNEPVEKDKKFQMLTYILSKGQRVGMAYKLYKDKDAWKVYDLEIEGVSIVKSYGSQYEEFLRDNPFGALLKKMRQKIDEDKAAGKAKKEQKK